MHLTLSEKHNPNYVCTIQQLGQTYPIPDADRVVRAIVNGFDIVVPKTMSPEDIVVYVPVETVLCVHFLSSNNEYKDITLNSNPQDKPGFFEKTGRVRITKLKGVYSTGYIFSTAMLENTYPVLKGTNWEDLIGVSFDTVDDELFCWKYIPLNTHLNIPTGPKHRKGNKWNRLIPDQFKFHYDTEQLPSNIGRFSPNDSVNISVKVHGTSIVLANILVQIKLNIFQKILQFFGFKIKETKYDLVYSSRSVVKNKYMDMANGFYSQDIWGCVAKVMKPFIPQQMTIYGEVVGYLENSTRMIQEKHDYGCKPGHWKLMPYRITITDSQGDIEEWDVSKVYEWTMNLISNTPELKEYILPINILYNGRFGDLYPDIPEDENWNINVLQRMKEDKTNFLMEQYEPMCKNKVPREGIVLRKNGDPISEAFKLKCNAHYKKECEEHDMGKTDIEELS